MARITKAELDERVTKVAELLLKGASRSKILRYSAESGWNVKTRQVEDYITKATARIIEDNKTDTETEIAKAQARYNDLYLMALQAKDHRGALQVQNSVMDRFGYSAAQKTDITSGGEKIGVIGLGLDTDKV